MEKRRCTICVFDKKVENHHIVKFLDFGSDEESNQIYLCPNHHWIADFGNEQDKKMLLRKIKEVTGKEGDIDWNKKRYIDKLIRSLIEETFGYLSDEEYNNEFYEKSFNYISYKNLLLSRNTNSEIISNMKKIKERGEILYLIKCLEKLLNKNA